VQLQCEETLRSLQNLQFENNKTLNKLDCETQISQLQKLIQEQKAHIENLIKEIGFLSKAQHAQSQKVLEAEVDYTEFDSGSDSSDESLHKIISKPTSCQYKSPKQTFISSNHEITPIQNKLQNYAKLYHDIEETYRTFENPVLSKNANSLLYELYQGPVHYSNQRKLANLYSALAIGARLSGNFDHEKLLFERARDYVKECVKDVNFELVSALINMSYCATLHNETSALVYNNMATRFCDKILSSNTTGTKLRDLLINSKAISLAQQSTLISDLNQYRLIYQQLLSLPCLHSKYLAYFTFVDFFST